MPNYDSKTTQVKLVRPAKVVSEELNQQLRMLKDKTKDLQQSLIMKQCKQRVSNFLGKEETLEYRQEELSRSLSLDNVTNIHFLMMYQLEDLRKFIDVLSQANASS